MFELWLCDENRTRKETTATTTHVLGGIFSSQTKQSLLGTVANHEIGKSKGLKYPECEKT